MNYRDFLASKRTLADPVGFEVDESSLNPMLFPFQKSVCAWALRRGRAALFEDCGLGKSPQELEWATQVVRHTGGNVIVLTPLAVGPQMAREAAKFGYEARVVRGQADVRPGISITNYEKLHHFDPATFSGIVLDESSCLKAYEGATRKAITEFASAIPYRLSATATPAPNDLIELTNQAEFLGVMTGKEIIALFFTQDGNTTHHWRLKGHAHAPFWRWLASWSVAIRRPSDLGDDDAGFVLPPLNVHPVVVKSRPLPGMLFPTEAGGLAESRAARRESLDERVAACAALANATRDPFLVWCDLNAESEALARAIPDAVEVRGSDSADEKEAAMVGFSEGRIRVVISKPSISGWGLNWQHCNRMAFVGLSYSFESYYQAVRRCWRFGQTRPVECHVITSEAEGSVVEAIARKERQAAEMMAGIVGHMAGLSLGRSGRDEMEYSPEAVMMVPDWMGVGA